MILGQKTSRNNSHCVLNLRMDGANDGTTFTDSSPSGKSVTRLNALTKTAIKKFGTASGYFNGSNAALTLADSADWTLGTGDFTIEFWLYKLSDSSVVPFTVDSTGSADLYAIYRASSSFSGRHDLVEVNSSNVVTGRLYTGAQSQYVGEWKHCVITRKSGVLKMFFDGILQPTTEDPSIADIPDYNGLLRIGSLKTSFYSYCYLDSFLYIKGSAKYQRSFIIPNRAA